MFYVTGDDVCSRSCERKKEITYLVSVRMILVLQLILRGLYSVPTKKRRDCTLPYVLLINKNWNFWSAIDYHSLSVIFADYLEVPIR